MRGLRLTEGCAKRWLQILLHPLGEFRRGSFSHIIRYVTGPFPKRVHFQVPGRPGPRRSAAEHTIQ